MTSTTSAGMLSDERITAFGRLVEAHRRLNRIFDKSLRAEFGISSVWFEALLRLGRSPDHRMGITELGEQLVLTSGGATRLVDRLVEAGYLERTACPDDRRVQFAQLTEEGLDLIGRAVTHHLVDLEQHFASQISEDELRIMNDVLDRLRSCDSGA
ncbi:MAG: winged helix-turn-helix transcriptional regulator [Acidimicrobiia bacterium]|nr:winged helix-turn-helix transcriptional regulator [Acidimicrobiia bacterium]